MLLRTKKHAHQRLAFTASDKRARRLAACKRFLRLEEDMIRMRHRGGESGLSIAHLRSHVIDVLLDRLLEPVLVQFPPGPRDPAIAIVALGGYGRGELSPHSDVDIMFLHPADVKETLVKEAQEKLTDEVLYILWDLNLTVGHSFRSIAEAIEEARGDMQTKTALLEARFVAGTKATFDAFEHAYRNFYRREKNDYIAARIKDQAVRRTKAGGTIYLQEPDIKRGLGGLRDYHNVLWMARVKKGVDSLEKLVEHQTHLRESDLRDMNEAYVFLLRVRNELHFSSSRATDVLHLDKQARIASALGYDEKDSLKRVEKFMRDYYRAARTIYRTARLIEKLLEIEAKEDNGKISFREVLRSRGRVVKPRRLDGFIHRDNLISAESENVFQEDPVRLVRVFRHCQQLGAKIEFHLSFLIRSSVRLLTPRVAATREACRSFLAILSDVGQVSPILEAMHELDVLGRFIPEWENLNCLVQHELYHFYTADMHTLTTIRELDKVFADPDPIYALYRREIRETDQPALLYAVLLLHDIGKAAGIKNHAENGAAIAEPILRRLGFDEERTQKALFLIKNHLTMARFWQRYDLDDPQTTNAFAEIVGDADRLRHLFVHTFCDSRGTSSSLWNGYKDTLHVTLFRNTAELFRHGTTVERQEAKRFEMTRTDLLSRSIEGVSKDEIDAHFSLLPERYFVYTHNDEIELHLKMVHAYFGMVANSTEMGALDPIIDWRDDLDRSLTVVNVVTWDRAGLFYKLAGALSLAGLNILSAKVMSRSDHIAIDTFHVVEPGGGIVQNQRMMDVFQENITRSLKGKTDLSGEIAEKTKKSKARLFAGDENPLLSAFTPQVDVYHELALQRTIVEVQAPDQIGLLYLLSKVITERNFDITFARVTTERGLAIDTFYVENSDPENAASTEQLQKMRDDLSAIVVPRQNAAVDF